MLARVEFWPTRNSQCIEPLQRVAPPSRRLEWPARTPALHLFGLRVELAEAVPFPFLLDHSSRVSRRRGTPRLYATFFRSL
jgi:hypothetical protein